MEEETFLTSDFKSQNSLDSNAEKISQLEKELKAVNTLLRVVTEQAKSLLMTKSKLEYEVSYLKGQINVYIDREKDFINHISSLNKVFMDLDGELRKSKETQEKLESLNSDLQTRVDELEEELSKLSQYITTHMTSEEMEDKIKPSPYVH